MAETIGFHWSQSNMNLGSLSFIDDVVRILRQLSCAYRIVTLAPEVRLPEIKTDV